MADLVLMGLKFAYKGVKLYQEKKQELLDFEDDYDELYLRLAAAEPVLQGLENNLNDSLALTLELTKTELDKCSKYCENLLAYCRKYKGFPLRTMANAVIGMGINMLPGDLQGPAGDLLECVGNAGIPEKAFLKYANKVHFLMTALGGAATTQILLNQTSVKSTGYQTVSTDDVKIEGATDEHGIKMVPAPSPAPVKKFTPPPPEMSMASILEDSINESEEEVRVILISGKMGKSTPWLYAVWLNKVPHLLIVIFNAKTPIILMIRRAPDNDFILKLQANGLDQADCMARVCCQAKRSRIDNTMNRAMRLTCSKLNINQFMYRWHYQKTVTNKLVFVPYAFICFYCCAGTCTSLTVREFECDGKKYHIQIQNSCDLYINRECKFKASDSVPQR